MTRSRLLIVHHEPAALAVVWSMLTPLGHEIDEATNDRMAARLMERGGVDLMIAGADPTDAEALELLAYMRRKHRTVPVILLFPASNPERTREALRMGALAVLRYPVPVTELRAAVAQALGPSAVPADHVAGVPPGHGDRPAAGSVPAPRSDSPSPARDWGIIGNDPSLRQAIELAASIAPLQVPVLIEGEPGTGKSLLARTLHQMASRGDRPFVALDCAALDESWKDDRSTPYGGTNHGAVDREWGDKLAQARGGTLHLDEVAALPDEIQLQLLLRLQDRESGSMGATHGPHSDVRLLLSTGEDLLDLVERGRFRQDLYHRISVIGLKLPPLRYRGTDIEQLAEFFRGRFAAGFGKDVVGFTRNAIDGLKEHDWPGNVRELEGVIRRGVMLCQEGRIASGHLAPSLGRPRPVRSSGPTPRPHLPMSIRPLKEALEEPEKRIILQALQALNWNRQETARVLDINRTTLYKKMKKYGLLVEDPIWVD